MKHYLGIELKLADFKITHWLLWQNEWWKPVLNYEGLYEASSLGRIRSLDRYKEGNIKSGVYRIKGQIISQKPSKNPRRYISVTLAKNGKKISYSAHRIIYIAFYGYKDLVINHKKLGNRSNNRLQNLEYVTYRENTLHYFASKNRTSEIHGVSFNKAAKKWKVDIRLLGKKYYLGKYPSEEIAITIQAKYFPLIINAKTDEEIMGIIGSLCKRIKSKTIPLPV